MSTRGAATIILVPLVAFVALASPTTPLPLEHDAKSIHPRGFGKFHFLVQYQSSGISFSDWVTLFTLCLAPIVAHLLAGVPEPAVLSGDPPRLFDRVCHYNPASILWRYFVIFDRRVRCLNWTPSDMAASNAHFWSGSSWNSSEDMMMRSRSSYILRPRRSYVDPLSASAAKTLIVTLQGAQALYSIALTTDNNDTSNDVNSPYSWHLSLATILQPLAILGLLRLPAALWISDEYAYMYRDKQELVELEPKTLEEENSLLNRSMAQSRSMEGRIGSGDRLAAVRFRPIHGFHGVAARLLYLVAVMALAGFTTYDLFPPRGFDKWITAPWFAQMVFFSFYLITTTFIFLYYFLRGQSTTTIIPCFNSAWYKVHTALAFSGILAMIVLAAIQTRNSPCGWTTFPPDWSPSSC